METHADQLFLQKSQPPGKKKKTLYSCYLSLLTDHYFGNKFLYMSFSFNI